VWANLIKDRPAAKQVASRIFATRRNAFEALDASKTAGVGVRFATAPASTDGRPTTQTAFLTARFIAT
jgi:hypothetical protein